MTKSHFEDARGASTVEYGILVGLLGVAVISSVYALGLRGKETFEDSALALTISRGVTDGTYDSMSDGYAALTGCFEGTEGPDTGSAADIGGGRCVALYGGDDTFDAEGRDGVTIHPGEGDDTILSSGDGTTIVYTAGNDFYGLYGGTSELQLPGVRTSDVSWAPTEQPSGPWMSILLAAPSGTITLDDQITSAPTGSSIGAQFAVFDDQVLTNSQMKQLALDSQITTGSDTVHGTVQADVLSPLTGNDRLYAYSGDDTVTYTGGDDTYDLGAGADTLIIKGFDFTDITNVSVPNQDGHVTMTFSATNELEIRNQIHFLAPHNNAAATTIIFDDQTFDSLDFYQAMIDFQEANVPNIGGSRNNDTIETTAITTQVRPYWGDDTIVYTPGSFSIFSETGGGRNSGYDVLDLSIYDSSEVTAAQSGVDIILTTPGGTVTLTDQVRYDEGANANLNIDEVKFSSGSWYEAEIRAAAGM